MIKAPETIATPKPQLYIRELGDSMWLFLDYGPLHRSLENRWAVEHRARDDWWGLVALHQWTHEQHLDCLADEISLGRQAIAQLKKARLH